MSSDKNTWFAESVAKGGSARAEPIHLVLEDGSVQTVRALAAVVEHGGLALALYPRDFPPDQGAATVMAVSIAKSGVADGSLVFRPGATNVGILSCESH